MTKKEHKESSLVFGDGLYLDWGVGYIVYVFVKAHWAVHLKYMHCIVYKVFSIKLIENKQKEKPL